MTPARARTTGPRVSGGREPMRPRERRALALLWPRVAQIPVVMFVVSVLLFWLIQVAPGDPGRNALGPYATPDQVAEWSAAHGSTGNVLERYGAWLGGFLTGDWGTSLVYGEPVLPLVLDRFVNSIALGLFAFVILVPLGIAIGALQARREGSRGDRATTIGLVGLASTPEFVIGVLLLVAFAVVVPILPVQSGNGVDAGLVPHLRAMTLPAVTLALAAVPLVARTSRSSIIDTTGSQHYRAAVIKGLNGRALFTRHVARNALIPTIALLGLYLGALLGGSAVVETLFGYPGLGELLVTATQRKDVLVLAAGVMLTGFVSLAALLAADLAFTAIDPRVRLAGAE